MVFVHWEKIYSVDSLLIDTEHRMLFLLCRKMDFALKNDHSEIAIRSIILELKTYTQFHFLSEENLMQEVAYPAIFEHSEIHRKLLRGLDDLTEDIARHRTSGFSMVEFLNSWLLNHIENFDKKLGQYIATSSTRPTAEKFYRHFLIHPG